MNALCFIEKLVQLKSEAERKKYMRFFKFSDAHPLVNDEFIGVRMGHIFQLAKEFIFMPLEEIEKLLESGIHEARVGAVSIMDFQARSNKFTSFQKAQLFQLYIRRHDRINNWGMVDRAAQYVVGGYLFNHPREILYQLVVSDNINERRTAIVSTAYFIRKNDRSDTFKLAEILMNDTEESIHKATGWMLRFAGNNGRNELTSFLDRHAVIMPRAMLRAAIEHYD